MRQHKHNWSSLNSNLQAGNSRAVLRFIVEAAQEKQLHRRLFGDFNAP